MIMKFVHWKTFMRWPIRKSICIYFLYWAELTDVLELHELFNPFFIETSLGPAKCMNDSIESFVTVALRIPNEEILIFLMLLNLEVKGHPPLIWSNN